jgi:hypothetical protein
MTVTNRLKQRGYTCLQFRIISKRKKCVSDKHRSLVASSQSHFHFNQIQAETHAKPELKCLCI